jgi:translation initiation factor eIF-2B subunit epsilon
VPSPLALVRRITAPCVPAAASPGRGSFFGSSDGSSDGEGGDGGPEPAAAAAARALAGGGIPETPVAFDTAVVGPGGAGFVWTSGATAGGVEAAERLSLAPPTSLFAPSALGDDDGDDSGSEGEGGGEAAAAGGGAPGGGPAPPPPEPAFKREVAETFLRCVKEGISQDNVVIELNGLKIAEDKTFADCARYMLTTALGLCLPPPPGVAREFRALYAAADLDAASREGRAELVRRAAAQLARWRGLLRKFLRSEEDQVEVLLTFEEFCGEEGDFEGTGERGAAFARVFPQLLKLLYDEDVVGEEAILQWADEKEHAEAEEKAFLELAAPLVAWLRQADEDSGEEGSSSGEEE